MILNLKIIFSCDILFSFFNELIFFLTEIAIIDDLPAFGTNEMMVMLLFKTWPVFIAAGAIANIYFVEKTCLHQ